MSSTKNIAKRAIDIILWFVLSLLIIRFILVLAGASTEAPFMQWVLYTTEPLLVPFKGLFNQPSTKRYLLEINTAVAIIFYAALAALVVNIINFLSINENKK